MQQRIKTLVALVMIIIAATITLSLLQRQAQAQTPDLSVDGAIYGGTNPPVSTKGPVLPCYLSTGLACGGTSHMVMDTETVSLSATCNPDQTCQLTSSTMAYTEVTLPNPPEFTNVQYACSATIWTVSPDPVAAYVGFCQPASQTKAHIYMFNPPGNPMVSTSASVHITYSAFGY